MSCANQHIIQRGAAVNIPIIFKDGVDGPLIDVDTTVVDYVNKRSGTTAAAGIDPTSITAAIAQVQDDTPANITGTYSLSFDSSLCAKGDSLIIGYTGTITATGQSASGTMSVLIVDDPAQRLVAC